MILIMIVNKYAEYVERSVINRFNDLYYSSPIISNPLTFLGEGTVIALTALSYIED